MATNELVHDTYERGRGRTSPASTRAMLPAAAILSLLAAAYLLINVVLPGPFSGFTSTYVVQPILWSSLALGIIALHWVSATRPRYSTLALLVGLLLGGFHIVAVSMATLLPGCVFSPGPYAHTVRYLFLNTVYFLGPIVGLEFTRACLLKTFGDRHTTTALVLSGLMYTFLMLPLTQLTHRGDTFVLLSGTLLPLLAQNMLASSLALVGGPAASIAYWGTMKAFEWYSPVLPNSPFIINTMAATLAAAIGLLVVQALYEKDTEPSAEAKVTTPTSWRSLAGWAATGVFCVIIIFAASGALGFRPTLVGSGSMGSALAVGDIALVTNASADGIAEGDIVAFARDGTMVMHRVIEIQDGEERVFITKGDANDGPDSDPVYAHEIQGRVSFRIPKLGWIAVPIKNLLN